MYQVLAVDMDDTLLASDGRVSAPTLAALQAWVAAGRAVVVATGRPPRSVGGSLPPLLAHVPWITYNGADARQCGEILHADMMDPAAACALVEWATASLPGWRIGVEQDDVLYLNRHLDIPKQYVQMDNLAEICHGPVAKVILSNGGLNRSMNDDVANLFAELNPLLENLPPGVRPMLSRRYGLAQFMSATADKAVALEHVTATLGYGMDDVVAFGDDVNDVDMLRGAGLGVAMANAVEEVHAVADRVTASNDEDGVSLVINELLFSSS